MKLHTINTGFFKLDGGAMFGVVPKSMWKKINPPDDNNMCTWAMRCMLIETGDRKILVDTGIGNKQSAKFRSHFEPHGDDSLIGSLAAKGFKPEDITDVLLTHLHFDHCGGAIKHNEAGEAVATFPNATYWSNEKHWNWAMNPNPREKASFLKENFLPLQEWGKLKFIEMADGEEWIDGISIHYAYGHTEAMMVLKIVSDDKTLIYCADLLPSSGHIPMPYVMCYDIRPLETLKEKKKLLERSVEKNYYLYFEHDPKIECATVHVNERGRIALKESFRIEEVF